jgi:acylphosphatase
MKPVINRLIKVYGKVQGVVFRWSAKVKADSLGINGFVRNEADGSLAMEVEGKPEGVDKFLVWVHRGPEYARVERVEVEPGKLKSYTDFTIV